MVEGVVEEGAVGGVFCGTFGGGRCGWEVCRCGAWRCKCHPLPPSAPSPLPHPYLWLSLTRPTLALHQTLGALLTEQKQYERAITVYDEDLMLFPNNPWALAGLAICCEATGSPRMKEVQAALEATRGLADIQIGASCACALSQWSK